jgi:hypothetical protein
MLTDGLRSWVQIPPGPLFPVLEIQYYSEFDLGNCPTNSAAVPVLRILERPTISFDDYSTWLVIKAQYRQSCFYNKNIRYESGEMLNLNYKLVFLDLYGNQ